MKLPFLIKISWIITATSSRGKIWIMVRMAQNHRRLGQNKLAEERLYELIKNKRSCEESTPALIYDDYNLLFKHLITYDL